MNRPTAAGPEEFICEPLGENPNISAFIKAMADCGLEIVGEPVPVPTADYLPLDVSGRFHLYAVHSRHFPELAALIKKRVGSRVQFLDLPMPIGVKQGVIFRDRGASMRYVRDYIIFRDEDISRWDILVKAA